MKCKNCFHYKVCNYHIDEESELTVEECPEFVNAADVAPVVRCKDCNHVLGVVCEYNKGYITPLNHFCGLGERREA